MVRKIGGPQITGQAVSKQTGAPLAGVTITVSATVYTDPELTSGTTTLTTNGTGGFSCYAAPGQYTFTCSDATAAAIEAVEVLGQEEGTGGQLGTRFLTPTQANASYLAVGAAPAGAVGARRRLYDARDYYTGLDDWGAAINRALTDAFNDGYTYGKKGQVKLPPGLYQTTTAIVPLNGVDLFGSGWGKCVIQPQGTISGLVQEGGLANVHMADFEIDGSAQTLTAGAYNVLTKGIDISNTTNVRLEHIYVHDSAASGFGFDFMNLSWLVDCLASGCGRLNGGSNPGGAGFGIGVGLNPEEIGFLINCVAKNNGRNGIFFEMQFAGQYATGYKVIGCHSEGNAGHGIADCGCDGLQVIGGVTKGNTLSGFACDAGTIATAVPGKNGLVQNLDTSGNTLNGIHYDSSAKAGLGGYVLRSNRAHGNTRHGIIIQPSGSAGSDVPDMVVTDNDCYGNARAGVSLTSATGAAGSGLKRPIVTLNRCRNNGSSGTNNDGIFLNANLVDAQIKNNRCWDDQGTPTQNNGINQNAGTISGNSLIEHNDVRGNINGPGLSLGGTVSSPAIVRSNPPYNPRGPAAITVTASPFTYTAGANPEAVYIDGGTVSLIVKAATTLRTSTGATVQLAPNESVTVTYTVAPTMTKDRQ